MPVQIDELNIDMAIEDDPSSSNVAQGAQHSCQDDSSDESDTNQHSLSRDEIHDLILELIEQTLARNYT